MQSIRIAIIGAGPAGLTLASLLQQGSVNFVVFDRDLDRDACSRGGSLDLHKDSGQRVLKEAGLYEELLKHARPEGETLRIIAPDGTFLMDESQGDSKRPEEEFANRPEIDRRLLRGMLLDSIETEKVHWNAKLLAVMDGDDGKLNLQFAHGTESQFDLVVGADGAWSKVREKISNLRPYYSGVGGLECYITDADNRRPALAKRVGKGMCLNLGENKGIMTQRNGDGGIQIYAFARLPENWYKESGVDFSQPIAKQQIVEALYPDWEQEAKDLILQSDKETFGRPLYMLPTDFKWNHDSRITLIGDAAHLMTPFAGVGVNIAMEDALELAEAILEHRQDGRNVASALEKYEVSMWNRAEEKAKATMMYLDLFFHKQGGVAMVEYFEQAKKAEAEAKLKSESEGLVALNPNS